MAHWTFWKAKQTAQLQLIYLLFYPQTLWWGTRRRLSPVIELQRPDCGGLLPGRNTVNYSRAGPLLHVKIWWELGITSLLIIVRRFLGTQYKSQWTLYGCVWFFAPGFGDWLKKTEVIELCCFWALCFLCHGIQCFYPGMPWVPRASKM